MFIDPLFAGFPVFFSKTDFRIIIIFIDDDAPDFLELFPEGTLFLIPVCTEIGLITINPFLIIGIDINIYA